MLYDCFPFFNELDLLEIRLHVLDPVVDRFVLVEATRTHQGKEKPLYFAENRERYRDFLHKITHVVVDDYPPNPQNDAWVFENHQRNCIARGLAGCAPDDVLLISDADEIPDPRAVLAERAAPGVKIFRQRMFCYFLNCVNATEIAGGRPYGWNGTVMIRYGDIRGDIQELRTLSVRLLRWFLPSWKRRLRWRWRLWRELRRQGRAVRFVENGGWHFTYLGGAPRIVEKLEAFAHSEYNRAEFKDLEKLEAALRGGADLFGRDFHYAFVPIDDSYPAWLRENLSRYAHLVRA
jgi:beta-1,4-mannosyl-glycoprotein beta-1,4-N-acetylglucosaminyltransferase